MMYTKTSGLIKWIRPIMSKDSHMSEPYNWPFDFACRVGHRSSPNHTPLKYISAFGMSNLTRLGPMNVEDQPQLHMNPVEL